MLLYVGVGGFFGAITRYWIAGALTRYTSTALGWSLPLGTAFVNVTGSFLLAVFLSLAAGQLQVSQPARLMIATGFFGAYTTFSTYSVESISLLEQGRFGAALVYILGMNVLCLLGAAAGIALVQWLTA